MDLVILSLVMLAIGIYGLLAIVNSLKSSLAELIATAATLNFVCFLPPQAA
jgi:NADH:ubiquinone oxidoreductase subunit K